MCIRDSFPLFLELISYVIASDMLSLIHCGCSTKEMFTYLHHLRKQGLSADASNALFNALQAGESFEDTVTSSMYLSEMCIRDSILIALTVFFMAGLCYGISMILPNEVVYETVMNAIVLPIFFLSSALFPAAGMNNALAIALSCNPFTLSLIHIWS